MAVIGSFVQQPADVLDWDIDVSALVEGGDEISSVATAVTPTTDPVLEATAFEIADDTVKVWVSGGVAGTAYKIEVTVTTVNGRVKQDELKCKIKEY